MAKAEWCTVTPMTGKENGIINISAAAYTGRMVRNTSVTVQAANGTRPSANIAVSQAGAEVSTTMDATKPDVPASGGVVTINGTSNSSMLDWKFGMKTGGTIVSFEHVYPVVFKVNNAVITKKTLIVGDPGASAIYNFVATVDLSVVKNVRDMPAALQVMDDSNAIKECSFTVKAAASSLSVNTSTLVLTDNGVAQAVNVISNDEWTVS